MKHVSDKFFKNLKNKTHLRIYTIQEIASLDNHELYLTGEHNHTIVGFEDSYQWMRSKMSEKISNFSGDKPIWAWIKKPSLKQIKQESGKICRITALIPIERILLSDFDTWHFVLNQQYLSLNEKDDKPTYTEEEMYDSWDKVFDIHPRTDKEIPWLGGKVYIQACVDRIYKDEIISVRYF